ncbi:MAG: XdhC family protein [Chloroflexi bacterium SZAS-1]|nr:XdhC family protein [Chloroflexi bacterium SZAS-1]
MVDTFFTQAAELSAQGIPFATATVVRAERPTSGKPGDKAIITADGTMYGWIGGSCAQPTVIREALAALRSDESRFVRLSPDPANQPPRDGLIDVPMTCFSGGTMEIYIEPQPPQPRLIIIGGLPVARALAELAQAMSYRTIVVDPGHSGAPPPYADALLTELPALAAHITPMSFVVVATHGQYDELALEQALATAAPYIGLVASHKRAAQAREYLAEQGFAPEQLTRFRSPAGLDIGARRGDEIALSIMAEIVQCRRGLANLAWQEAPAEQAIAAPAEAIDPVCGMSVEIAGAKYTYEHQGTTFYFCCPACRKSFMRAPEEYLVEGA